MRRERASMHDTWLHVLARDPGAGKTRLSSVLGQSSRADLAAAMLADVLAAAGAVAFARRVVVTESEAVRNIARAASVEALHATALGTNSAASAAVGDAIAAGAPRVLLLAADLPYLLSSELELFVADRAAVAIAPDRHRRGTNGLLLTPPSVIATAFGENSFRSHLGLARRASVAARVIASRGLATDVDDADDLQLLLSEPGIGPHTNEVVRSASFTPAIPAH
jgi:2-phospho-L-lactate guanylyltransferase